MVAGTHSDRTALETLPDYCGLEAFSVGRRYVHFRGVRRSDGAPVVIKTTLSDRPKPTDVSHLQDEYKWLTSLTPNGTPRALALHEVGHTAALVLEDVGTKTLGDLIDGAPLDLETFFFIAIPLAEVLGHIHDTGIAHLGLSPRRLILDAGGRRISIVGFGASAAIPETRTGIGSPSTEVSLPYLSPEQTGRMNQPLDQHSDLYSLGAIFYEMLVGAPPFVSRDPLTLVHCHVSSPPVPPDARNARVPSSLSRIVLKLLSKAPQDRYQSAGGLVYDLRLAQQQISQNIVNQQFVLGLKDTPCGPPLTTRIYGRDAELRKITDSFERTMVAGHPNLFLIAGYTGAGKTALAEELYETLLSRRGLFLAGKFDAFSSNVPFSTIAQALRQLIQYLLAEPEFRIAIWRQRLQQSLGSSIAVISRLLPELEMLIGAQPPPAILPPPDEHIRFYVVLRQFLSLFATEEHPLVIFLDDLQWADDGSLRLIKSILTDPHPMHLFLIGAYRSNEVGPEHRLSRMLDELKQTPDTVEQIELSNLELKDVTRWLADSLHSTDAMVSPLVSLIYAKTQGNPFFITQFLKALYQEKLLQFDQREGVWHWDLARVRAHDWPDNVVDLITSRLRSLPEETLQVMRFVACHGTHDDLNTLASLCDKSPADIARDLRESLRQGLILQQGNTYKFPHDNVQQSTYSLIVDQERQEKHLKIGRQLINNPAAPRVDDELFDAVNQMNLGLEALSGPAEKLKLAELNLLAGRQARRSTAYVSAIQFLSTGLSLLEPDSWQTQHELAYNLHIERAQCAWMIGAVEEAQHDYGEILARCTATRERVNVYRMQVELLTSSIQMMQAVKCELEGLRLFGLDIPTHPSDERVMQEYHDICRLIGNRQIEDLSNLPVDRDEEMRAALLEACMIAARCIDHNLFFLLSCLLVKFSLQSGNCPLSGLGYINFGVEVGKRFGRYRDGLRFGQLACTLAEKHGFDDYRSRVIGAYGISINHWVKPLQFSIDYMYSAFHALRETGDLTSGILAVFLLRAMLMKGMPLSDVFQESQKFLEHARQRRMTRIQNCILGTQRLIQNMRGLTANFSTFNDDDFDEREHAEIIDTYEAPEIACVYYTDVMQARFMSGDYEQAIQAAGKIKKFFGPAHGPIAPLVGTIHEPEYWYFYPLVLAAHYAAVSDQEQAAYLQTIGAHEKQLALWSASCPENFQHKHSLVAAELARLKGEPLEAMRLYEQAIRSASDNGFIQDEGIACELAGKLCLDQGYDTVAAVYLDKARACYRRWGADGKAAHMQHLYSQLLDHAAMGTITPVSPDSQTAQTISQEFDLMTVIQTSQAISQDIEIDHLLQRMMRVLVQTEGAQRGILLLESHGKFVVRAHTPVSTLDSTAANPWHEPKLPVEVEEIPLAKFSAIPQTIINYVQRSRDTVILDDAMNTGLFTNDPYVRKHKIRSVLCVPIMKQSKLAGILYFENNLAPKVFSSARTSLLQLLSSQIITSLENGMLFENLRKEVGERKHAEEATRRSEEQLRALNQDLESRVMDRTNQLAAAKEAAEAANVAKGEFLANVSHEIRTPMNAIIGMNELLLLSHLTTEQKDLVQTIQQSADVLLQLINDLLDFSKMEAGMLELQETVFDLAQVVEDSASILADAAGQKALTLSACITAEPSCLVRGDRFRLQEVLINLIGNAIKFTEKGHVLVRVTGQERSGGTFLCRITVQDTGIGITPSDMQRLFRPFVQSDASITRRFGGTGLGLAICKRLVELMGGEIGVESEEGLGSTFWFTIPLALSDVRVEPLQLAAELQGKRALTLRGAVSSEIICAYVGSWKLRTDVANSVPAAARAMFRAWRSGDPYEMLFLDEEMLDQAALLLHLLKRRRMITRTKLIVVSSLVRGELPAELSELNPASIFKPIIRTCLHDLIVRLFTTEKKSLRPEVQQYMPPSSEELEMEVPILVVEDNAINRQLTLLQLKKLGFSAHSVSNGLEAVRAVGERPYALVLMDCQMPQMDGFEATRLIREKELSTGRHLPVVALTAGATRGDLQKCLRAGMDDYLVKPVKLEQLQAMVNKWKLSPARMYGFQLGSHKKQGA